MILGHPSAQLNRLGLRLLPRYSTHVFSQRKCRRESHSLFFKREPVQDHSVHIRSKIASFDDAQAETQGVEVEEGLLPTVKPVWCNIPGVPLLALPVTLSGVSLDNSRNVLEAIAVLAVIVFVHECGHFLAARIQNIPVSKFSIGFGPVLAKFDGTAGVEYTIRAIPLGGFVAFPDDDVNAEGADPAFDPDNPDLLKNRPILDRAIVISAGVVANVVFAFLIVLTEVSTVGILSLERFEGVAVTSVTAGQSAEVAGVKSGDVIVKINDFNIGRDPSNVGEVVSLIKESTVSGPLSLELVRNGEIYNITVPTVPAADGTGRIGVQLSPNGVFKRTKAGNFLEALQKSSTEFSGMLGTIVDGLGRLVFDFDKTKDKISGPVAIVAAGAEVAKSGPSGLFQFAALVNLNLAVVNVLPLPALDGGFLLLLLIEAVRGGKKLPKNVERGIMSSGILLLLCSGVFLIVRDTLTLGGLL